MSLLDLLPPQRPQIAPAIPGLDDQPLSTNPLLSEHQIRARSYAGAGQVATINADEEARRKVSAGYDAAEELRRQAEEKRKQEMHLQIPGLDDVTMAKAGVNPTGMPQEARPAALAKAIQDQQRQPSQAGRISLKDMGDVGLDGTIIPEDEWPAAYAEAKQRTAKAALRPSAEIQKKIQNAAVILQDLDHITKQWEKSPDYGMTQRALASKVQTPSQGFFDGIARGLAAKFADDNIEELAALTNRVNGLIAFAQGGASLTPSEQKALSVIDITDAKPVALKKLQNAIPMIRKEMSSQVAQYPGVFPELEKILAANAPAAEVPPAGPSDRVSVISPDGKQGTIPRTQLDEALKEGYKAQ